MQLEQPNKTKKKRTRKLFNDLLWAMYSPQILSNVTSLTSPQSIVPDEFLQTLVHDSMNWINTIDEATLLNYIQQKQTSRSKPLALGMYFSYLVEFWLEYCPGLAQQPCIVGKQLFAPFDNRTIGQLKFVFPLQSHYMYPYRHWECSVKFFLFTDLQQYQLEAYIGPHLGENLAWRVIETKRKLQLTQHQDVKQWLYHEFQSQRVYSQCLLKGYLFYPIEQLNSTTSASEYAKKTATKVEPHHEIVVSCSHLAGWWTTDISLLEEKQVSSDSMYVSLDKMHWLSEVEASREKTDGPPVLEGLKELGIPSHELVTLEEIIRQVKHYFLDAEFSSKPLMIAEMIPETSAKLHYKEVSRGFVLHPDWDPSPLSHAAARYKRTKPAEADKSPVQSRLSDREYEYVDREQSQEKLEQELNEKKIRVEGYHSLPTKKGPPELKMETSLALLNDLQTRLAMTKCPELKKSLARQFKGNERASHLTFSCIEIIFRHTFEAQVVLVHDPTKIMITCAHYILDAFNSVKHLTDEVKQQVEMLFLRGIKYLKHESGKLTNVQWSILGILLKTSDIFECQFLETQCLDPDIVESLLEWIEQACHTTADSEPKTDQHSLATQVQIVTKLLHTFVIEVDPERILQVLHRLIEAKMFTAVKTFVDQLESKYDFRGEVVQVLEAIPQPTKLVVRMLREYQRLLHRVAHRPGVLVGTEIPVLEWDKGQHQLLVVDSCEAMDLAFNYLEELIIDAETQCHGNWIGIDCEWQPQAFLEQSPEDARGVSLVQLAFTHHVLLFDLHVVQVATRFRHYIDRILKTSSVDLVGFCIQGDFKRLLLDYPEMQNSANKVIELRRVARGVASIPIDQVSLNQLAIHCIGERMNKSQQTSNWAARPLSQEQIEYAALDAICVLKIIQSFADSFTHADLVQYQVHIVESAKFALSPDDVRQAVVNLGIPSELYSIGTHAPIPEKEVVVKTLGFILHEKTYLAVLLHLDAQVSLELLASYFHSSPKSVRLVTTTELVEVFGYQRYCLGPYGLRNAKIRIVLDQSLMQHQVMVCGAGAMDHVIRIAPQTLIDTTPHELHITPITGNVNN